MRCFVVLACLSVYQPISYRLCLTSEVLAPLVDSKNVTYPYISKMPPAVLAASVYSLGYSLPTLAVCLLNRFLLMRCYLQHQFRVLESAMCEMCVSEKSVS